VKVRSARFVTSAAEALGWPDADLPEVCFAGRSNVGKSSLMNALMERKGLVKVSSKPGKTRLINFFVAVTEACEISLADLPGYGYAKVSHARREAFARMVGEYLDQRAALRACVLLLDIRRAPGEEEREFLRWLQGRDLRWILVATKCDKVSATALGGRVQSIADQLSVSPKSITPTSVTSGRGRETLWRRIHAACR